MCGQNPLMAFQPHLTSENVHVVSKVATKIPLSSGGHLQASDIFKTFAEKLFWDTHPNKEKNNTEVKLKHFLVQHKYVNDRMLTGCIVTNAVRNILKDCQLQSTKPSLRTSPFHPWL